jgi:hypothetical protein
VVPELPDALRPMAAVRGPDLPADEAMFSPGAVSQKAVPAELAS